MKLRILLLTILATFCFARRPKAVIVRNTCDNIPSTSHKGPGCGVPDYIPNFDIDSFGDNNFSRGILRITPRRNGLNLNFKLVKLPVPDLVITAWIQWIDPTSPDKPDIFKVGADYVSPCAPFTAGFTSGLGREPNQFEYVSATSAKLNARLNFNPLFPKEGALHRMVSCFQKDVPGIQKTDLQQYPNPRTGEFVPSGSSFLRRFDPDTGYMILGKDGKPELVKSPTRALSIIVASHLDRTTHGITPGKFMTDHYDLMVFPLTGIVVGRPTVGRE